MIHKLGVDIVRDFLDHKKCELDDLLCLEGRKRTENFCRTVVYELEQATKTEHCYKPGACKQGILQ